MRGSVILPPPPQSSESELFGKYNHSVNILDSAKTKIQQLFFCIFFALIDEKLFIIESAFFRIFNISHKNTKIVVYFSSCMKLYFICLHYFFADSALLTIFILFPPHTMIKFVTPLRGRGTCLVLISEE